MKKINIRTGRFIKLNSNIVRDVFVLLLRVHYKIVIPSDGTDKVFELYVEDSRLITSNRLEDFHITGSNINLGLTIPEFHFFIRPYKKLEDIEISLEEALILMSKEGLEDE